MYYLFCCYLGIVMKLFDEQILRLLEVGTGLKCAADDKVGTTGGESGVAKIHSLLPDKRMMLLLLLLLLQQLRASRRAGVLSAEDAVPRRRCRGRGRIKRRAPHLRVRVLAERRGHNGGGSVWRGGHIRNRLQRVF